MQNIWVSVSGDLEYAKSAVQEVFYTLDLGPEKEAALVQLADTVLAVPARVEQLFSQATQEGYKVTHNITPSQAKCSQIFSIKNILLLAETYNNN